MNECPMKTSPQTKINNRQRQEENQAKILTFELCHNSRCQPDNLEPGTSGRDASSAFTADWR